MIDREIGLYDIEINKSKKYFRYKKELKVGITLIILLGIFLFAKNITNIKISGLDNEEIIKENIEVKEWYIEDNIYDEKYKKYIDNEFKFYCAFPKDYIIGESIGGGNRITFASESGDAHIFVGAIKNTLNLSAEDVMNQYIAESGENVAYKAFEDTWYAVSKVINGVSYYRKCFVEDTIRWFEFSVKESSKEPVGEYIEYIEDNFKNID